jgi:hypothetical protein
LLLFSTLTLLGCDSAQKVNQSGDVAAAEGRFEPASVLASDKAKNASALQPESDSNLTPDQPVYRLSASWLNEDIVLQNGDHLRQLLKPCLSQRKCEEISISECDRCSLSANRVGNSFVLWSRLGAPWDAFTPIRKTDKRALAIPDTDFDYGVDGSKFSTAEMIEMLVAYVDQPNAENSAIVWRRSDLVK